MAGRVQAIDCGGIGAFHLLARNSGLINAIKLYLFEHVIKPSSVMAVIVACCRDKKTWWR